METYQSRPSLFKDGQIDYLAPIDKKVKEQVDTYNSLLREGTIHTTEVPAEAKVKIQALLHADGIESAVLEDNMVNCQTLLIREDKGWIEYRLHTCVGDLFRSMLSIKQDDSKLKITHIEKRKARPDLNYLFRFRRITLCNKERLKNELVNLLQVNASLQLA